MEFQALLMRFLIIFCRGPQYASHVKFKTYTKQVKWLVNYFSCSDIKSTAAFFMLILAGSGSARYPHSNVGLQSIVRYESKSQINDI